MLGLNPWPHTCKECAWPSESSPSFWKSECFLPLPVSLVWEVRAYRVRAPMALGAGDIHPVARVPYAVALGPSTHKFCPLFSSSSRLEFDSSCQMGSPSLGLRISPHDPWWGWPWLDLGGDAGAQLPSTQRFSADEPRPIKVLCRHLDHLTWLGCWKFSAPPFCSSVPPLHRDPFCPGIRISGFPTLCSI